MPRLLRALAAVAVVMLVLDLTWLGIAAAPLYDRGLAHLKAPEVNVLAAGLFYAMYVVVTTLHALPGATVKAAAGQAIHIPIKVTDTIRRPAARQRISERMRTVGSKGQHILQLDRTLAGV
jgi:hypothetical protein